ncbi:MAG: hypothetical protein AAFY29_22775 [Pseudomonadota bacterium]
MPSIVQTAGGSSTRSVTFDAPCTAGNDIFVMVCDGSVGSDPTIEGYAPFLERDDGGPATKGNMALFRRISDGTEKTTPPFAGASARAVVIGLEVEGADFDIDNPVFAFQKPFINSVVSPLTRSVAAPADGTLAIVFCASAANFNQVDVQAPASRLQRHQAVNSPQSNWPTGLVGANPTLYANGETITLGVTDNVPTNKTLYILALPPAASGPATIAGDASTTLDDTTVASAGVVDNLTGIGGDAAAALDGVAIDSQGSLAISAGGTMILDTVGLASQGSIGITAAAAVGLDAIALSASGIVLAGIAGSAALTLDNATLAAGGALSTPESNGSATIALGDLVLAAAGEIGITAQAALTLDDITLASSSQSIIGGQATNVLEQLTLAADGSLEIRAAFDVVLEDTGLASAGIATPLDPIAGDLVVTLEATTLSAGAVQVREGNAAITLADLSLRGQGFLEDAYDPGAIVYRVDRLETSFALLEVHTHPTRRGIMKTVEAKQGDAIEIYAAPEPVQDLTGWQCRVRVAADKTENPLIDELVLGRNGSNTAVEDRLLTDALPPGRYHLMTKLWKASTNQSREIHQRLRIETSGHD